MTKEEKYTNQLKELGIWEPAFAPAVHDLAMAERERDRARKAWKATAEPGAGPSFEDPHYAIIMKQGAAIQSMRESLGLTPKGLRRFRSGFGQGDPDRETEKPKTMLELIQEKKRTGT